MSRKNGLVALSVLFLIMVATPAIAAPMQDGGAATGPEDVKMAISIAAAFAMGIASGACGLGQGRAVAAACDGMARNPSAGGQIRGSLIIGLVLIESLAIYTLLIGLVLVFLKWGT
jgi:F-type H+-transporting ATPase subunit c|tara:strand:+ start:514 stop:861 length:348 start_codon:yes stop_codon:yes gene_type:complete